LRLGALARAQSQQSATRRRCGKTRPAASAARRKSKQTNIAKDHPMGGYDLAAVVILAAALLLGIAIGAAVF
jgi:hypothetical protein